MIAQMHSPVLVPRRLLMLFPLALLPHARAHGATLASSVERELIATVERDAGLLPPLTLGIARVVLRPGASTFAATPNGARMIVVESGVLAVASVSQEARPLTSIELGVSAPAPDEGEELFVPAGTTVTFGSLEVARVRNPGARSVVALDVAVFREEPRRSRARSRPRMGSASSSWPAPAPQSLPPVASRWRWSGCVSGGRRSFPPTSATG